MARDGIGLGSPTQTASVSNTNNGTVASAGGSSSSLSLAISDAAKRRKIQGTESLRIEGKEDDAYYAKAAQEYVMRKIHTSSFPSESTAIMLAETERTGNTLMLTHSLGGPPPVRLQF